MIRFEIKKIFSRTACKISLALLLALILAISWFAIGYVDFVDETGKTHRGFAASRALQEQRRPWEGPITEEVLRRVIRENRTIISSPEYNSEDVTQQNIAYSRGQGFDGIRSLINRAFCPFREYNYYRINTLTEEDMARFYEGRTQALKTWLDSDEAADRFTEAEKSFLLGRYRELETPYRYAYSAGWEAALEYAPSVIMLTMLFLVFYVSGIFSGETQTRADAIFFAAKLGRSSAVRAKTAAGVLITTVTYWAAVLLYSGIVFAVTGLGGADCPIQIWIGGWKSYYNLTFCQLYLLTVFGGWIGTLAITGISMTISAKLRSSLVAVSVPVVLLFLPSFLGNLDACSAILGLLPEQLLTLSTVVSSFQVYSIGTMVTGSVPVLLAVYSALAVLLLPLMYGIYKRTQIA